MQAMNKVLQGQQYIANFLDQPLGIGSIFRMDDKQSILAREFSDSFPSVDLARYTSTGSRGTLKFSEQASVSITFGASATTTLGESAVALKFKRARTAAGAFNDAFVASLRYDAILEQLRKLWVDQGYVNYRREYFLVFEVVTAASGTFIYSEDRNNEIVLKHTLGEPVTKLADLGSGNFEYVSNTKRTLEIIRTIAHKPLFKAFRFKANWEPEVLG